MDGPAETHPRVQPQSMSLDHLIDRARAMIHPGPRRLLGIAGSPGAGKSTLAAAMLDALGPDAVLVPMDGFHLANEELQRLGRRDRKGAPDTFDVDGYATLLGRLRNQREPVIYAPRFNRELEESIGSAIPITRETPLVITEGNYLLLAQFGWETVRPQLDEVWFLDIEPSERTQRLVDRRQSHGHAVAEATQWVRDVDNPNAELVDATRHRADLIVRLESAPDR